MTTTGDTPTDPLDAVRDADRCLRAAELAKARAVLAFLDAHPAESIEQAAGLASDSGPALHGERPLLLGGPGTPLIAEFCLAELAVALGIGTDSARVLASDLLELRHRLPLTWARVEGLDLALWRARRISSRTTVLDRHRAASADRWLARKAHRLSLPALDRTVTRLIHSQVSAAEAAAIVDAARERRHVTISLPSRHAGCPSGDDLAGLASIDGRLDVLDAADLDQALDLIATRLVRAGLGASNRTPGQLRAEALGILARGQLLLPLDDVQVSAPDAAATHVDPTTGEATALAAVGDRHGSTRASRELVLHVHLSAAAVTGDSDATDRAQLATVESGPARVIDVETVRAWCRAALTDTGPTAGQTHITVRPVLDLSEHRSSPGREPAPRLREQVVLRDRTCVFPGCDRAARLGDLDHIDAWHHDGSGGSTSTGNLAALCRLHHRLKTHGRWRYRRIGPSHESVYEWRSPTGRLYRRHPDGTIDDLGPRSTSRGSPTTV